MAARTLATRRLAAGGFTALLAAANAWAQAAPESVEAHRAAAQAAAGRDFQGVMDRACPAVNPPAPRARPAAATAPRVPPRDEWYAEPVKVFDNLYFVGTKVHGSWAVTTSAGIMVIDALYDYAVESEVDGGLRKLGLDPANIKYLVVSHGHGDHHGGAKYIQDHFGPRLLMGPLDWDLVERDTRNPKPRRDLVATDGQKLTLGDTTLTLYITPGHTPSTISTLVPVKDGGRSHLAAEWGGTAISAATPIDQLRSYSASAARFRDAALGAGADVIIANHTAFDLTLDKLAALGTRKPGDPNPWIVGKDGVNRYLTVAEECGKATLASIAK
jgi:metallo-beta-lactamase class B